VSFDGADSYELRVIRIASEMMAKSLEDIAATLALNPAPPAPERRIDVVTAQEFALWAHSGPAKTAGYMEWYKVALDWLREVTP
jgi:hypothetical protein